MGSRVTTLNDRFGARMEQVRSEDLRDGEFQRRAYALWSESGGLLAVRGAALAELTPEELVDWSRVFGNVEQEEMAGRDESVVTGFPILRIGNVKDTSGNLRASFAKVPELARDDDVQYNPTTRRPVWHTDSTFRANPPIGSVFHCKQAPPHGGETLFADTCGAYNALDDDIKDRLSGLEAVCSLAHHDKKISLYSPGYPVLTAEQRAANPPQRVPVVLTHPVTGKRALYGLNSSTCAIVPFGAAVSQHQLDRFDLEGLEDDSVAILRDLLPFVTGPEFTVRWYWQPGDVVVWDNRCTIHAATGFDDDRYEREMWRLTLVNPPRQPQRSTRASDTL